MNNLFKLSIFLLIFLNLLPASFVRDTVDIGHFFSSVHMFEYAFNHSFQFGVDIVDNVGPYGYLHYPYIYAGGAFWSKSLWFALICFVYAYYAASLTQRIRSLPEKLLFLFSAIFFPYQSLSPFVSFEVIPRLAILFSAIYVLTESREKLSWRENAHIIVNGFFYAFLTLEKASNVYYLAFLIFILSVHWFSRSQWRNSLILVCSYLFGLAVFWLIAGQHHLSALPGYFASMSFFIDAYQENLVAEMGERNFLYGLLYCAVAATLIIFRLALSFFVFRTRKQLPVEIFRSALVAALFFLTWKHGMLRGLPSYGTFLYTMPILFAYLCFYPIAIESAITEKLLVKRFPPIWLFVIFRSSTFALLLVVIWSNILSVAWVDVPLPPSAYSYKHMDKVIKEFSDRLSDLMDYRPAQVLKVLDAKLQKLKHENALPSSLKETMQSGRVDEFGNVPEILLLNDLDYRPRPVPIDFIAGNSALNDKNGRYYQNIATAPDFVLLEEFGLRLTDSSAYLGLLFNYQAIQTFKTYLVMEKRSSNWQRIELRKLSESQGHFDEWVFITSLQKSLLWVEIDAEASILGKMKRFFYKPDLVRLDIMLDDGTTRSMPVSLGQLRSGFLFNPLIKTRKDLVLIAQDKTDVPWDLAKAFRITLDVPEKSGLFQQAFKIKFSEVTSSSPSDANPVPVDISRASSLINLYAPNFPVANTKLPINLLTHEVRDDIYVRGLSDLESNSKESWRWAIGPSTRIKFYVDPASPEQSRQRLLKFAFKNGASIPDQSVTLRLNGKDVYHFSSKEIAKHQQIDAEVALASQKGNNVLEFVYNDWNHGKKNYSPDSRQLAIVYTSLSLDAYPALLKFPKESPLIKLNVLDAPAVAAKMPIVATKMPVDLFVTEVRDDIEVEGLSDLESNNKESWRWAVGPATHIRFYVDPASPEQARQRLLKLAFKNEVPIKDQTVTIRLNGKDIRSFSVQEIDTSNQVDAEVMLTAKAGSNILTFVYGGWNHGKQNYGSNDPRKLAVVVMRLSLQETK